MNMTGAMLNASLETEFFPRSRDPLGLENSVSLVLGTLFLHELI